MQKKKKQIECMDQSKNKLFIFFLFCLFSFHSKSQNKCTKGYLVLFQTELLFFPLKNEKQISLIDFPKLRNGVRITNPHNFLNLISQQGTFVRLDKRDSLIEEYKNLQYLYIELKLQKDSFFSEKGYLKDYIFIGEKKYSFRIYNLCFEAFYCD